MQAHTGCHMLSLVRDEALLRHCHGPGVSAGISQVLSDLQNKSLYSSYTRALAPIIP
jgi:hypothetical protein